MTVQLNNNWCIIKVRNKSYGAVSHIIYCLIMYMLKNCTITTVIKLKDTHIHIKVSMTHFHYLALNTYLIAWHNV